jgi:hypothetical protein
MKTVLEREDLLQTIHQFSELRVGILHLSSKAQCEKLNLERKNKDSLESPTKIMIDELARFKKGVDDLRKPTKRIVNDLGIRRRDLILNCWIDLPLAPLREGILRNQTTRSCNLRWASPMQSKN